MCACDQVCVLVLSAEGLVGGVVRNIQAPRANYNARFYGSSSKCWLVKPLLFPPIMIPHWISSTCNCFVFFVSLAVRLCRFVCFVITKTDAVNLFPSARPQTQQGSKTPGDYRMGLLLRRPKSSFLTGPAPGAWRCEIRLTRVGRRKRRRHNLGCFLVFLGRPDLMDNYLAFVLSAFISSGLLEVSQTIALKPLKWNV